METEEIFDRKKLLNSIEREIVRDLLSIATLNMTLETGNKHSRSEALREMMLKYYKHNEPVINQIYQADSKRDLK